MKTTVLLSVVAGMALSGCASLYGDPTDSSFTTPSSTGSINRTNQSRAGSEFSSITGNGYAYEVGGVTDDGLQGFAGLVPGASVAPPPSSGVVQMTGSFEVAVIDFILANGASVSGQSTLDRGNLTLNVNFGTGAVTGFGTGIDSFSNIILDGNTLAIDGQLNGSTLTGTATYDGVSGPLRGLVGSNEAIGAFHGHNDSQVHAGGFIAN